MVSLRRMSVCTFLMLCVSTLSQAIDLPVSKIACGEAHSIVIASNGYAFACGDGQVGLLGVGNIVNTRVLNEIKGANNVYFLSNVLSAAGGYLHSVFLGQNHCVYTSGNGGGGRLGIGFLQTGAPVYDRGYREYPVQVLSGEQDNGTYLHDIIDVAAGRTGSHCLAVTSDGHVYSWGSGPLGDGSDNPQYIPVRVHDANNNHSGLEHIVNVAAGYQHSMALEDSAYGGRVYCFGVNTAGQIGQGTSTSPYHYPKLVLRGNQPDDPAHPSIYLKHITKIAAGFSHCLALDASRNVYIWGTRTGLNMGATDNRVPQRVPGPGGSGDLSNIIDISAGDGFSMALDADGKVWIWGSNGLYYRLGIDSTSQGDTTTYPVQVHDGDMNTASGYLENISAVAAGYYHALALDNNGVVWCWGGNSTFGQLGLGAAATANQPAPKRMIPPHKYDRCFSISQSSDRTNADVLPGDSITYNLSYACIDSTDPNTPSSFPALVVTDTLPKGVTFLSATNGGDYDEVTHTVTWTYTSPPRLFSATQTITGEINDCTEPPADLINQCHIEDSAAGTYGKSANTITSHLLDWSASNDFNNDNRVTMADFAIFRATWQKAYGSQYWNSACDLNNDHSVDLSDFGLFLNAGDPCGCWLWAACWAFPPAQGENLENMMMPLEGDSMMASSNSESPQLYVGGYDLNATDSESPGLYAQGSAPTPATRSIADRLNSLTRAAELTSSILDDPAAMPHLSADQIQKLQSTLDSLNTMIDDLESSQSD